MEKEIWCIVPEYPNYQVSNLGRVMNLKFGKYMSYYPDNAGYLQVTLCKESKGKPWRVHNLVARLHVPNLRNFPEVNIIDGNKQNLRADNLQWMDAKAGTSELYIAKLKSKAFARNKAA